MDLIPKPVIGFLHPSDMTPEERLDELAAILASGFLRRKAGIPFPEDQAQTVDIMADKPLSKTESLLEACRP